MATESPGRERETPLPTPTAPVEPGTHTREALTEWGIEDVEHLLVTGSIVQRGEEHVAAASARAVSPSPNRTKRLR